MQKKDPESRLNIPILKTETAPFKIPVKKEKSA